jgi:N6-adenosine-specific RNA methylase IME4
MFIDIFKNDKRYQVIYADPPWDYGKMKERKQAYRGGNPSAHYQTMTLEGICRLPVKFIGDRNAALFLWVTNPKLSLGLAVMEAWGFKYQTLLTWVKTMSNGEVANNGLGFYFRGATEHILFGTRNQFRIPPALRVPNVFLSTRNGHSYKPECVYQIIESISQGPRIELFARCQRDGWDYWGNEVE